MKKDIFKGFFGIGWITVIVFIIAGALAPELYKGYIYVLFFFALGGLCLYNYRGCGRIHCQITGWGYIGVGIIALLQVLDIIKISFNIIWLIFILVTVIGYGYEYLQKDSYAKQKTK